MEIVHARKKGRFKCKEMGHIARLCPQNNPRLGPILQLNKRLNKNKAVHYVEQSPRSKGDGGAFWNIFS